VSTRPEVQYAKNGDVHLAYQVLGDGPFDLVFIPGWLTHLDAAWEDPGYVRLVRRLASFSRLIVMDKRGAGLSDRGELPTLEEQVDDLGAVLDAVGSTRAALFGSQDGATIASFFAATSPERVRALVMWANRPRFTASDDYPVGMPQDVVDSYFALVESEWGKPSEITMGLFAPSRIGDPVFTEWFGHFIRTSMSPASAVASLRIVAGLDVRKILGAIQAPTLLLRRQDDPLCVEGDVDELQARIPDARSVVFPGADDLIFIGDVDAVVDEIEEFLTGTRGGHDNERVLATVMFTDIVESTRLAADVGDRRWRDLLDTHDAVVGRELDVHRGRQVKATGDGVLATFDGPARAIRCAAAVREGLRPVGLEVRAGLHTGEVEVRGDDIGGIAVNIAQRVQSLADPGEVLVSSTVKDLVAGSGLAFDDRGTHALKGVPDEWRLYAVT
jgi:class 3 adenylate cyclase